MPWRGWRPRWVGVRRWWTTAARPATTPASTRSSPRWTSARYVGLVASRKRAEAVMGYLRDRGVSEDQLARVHAPAGLDLGHVGPEEIAVAIMAELVQLKAAGDLGPRLEVAPASEMHEA